MGRNTWASESCAQNFTSRYSENRHNRNLHDGKGIIVRILDYVVGRLSGQFLSNDQLAYRRKRENEKNQSLYGSNYNNNKSRPKVIADRTSDIISYDSNHQWIVSHYSTSHGNNTCEKSYDDPNLLSRLNLGQLITTTPPVILLSSDKENLQLKNSAYH